MIARGFGLDNEAAVVRRHAPADAGPAFGYDRPRTPHREAAMGDWYEKQTIGLLPERAARRWGQREALAFQGKRWRFTELHTRVDAVAKGC